MIEPLTQLNTKRFQVALSFAGEHRNFVAGVAEHLSRNLGQNRVFYDRYYEAELARPNLDTYLMDIYREHADLIAIFLCANYTQKEWCGLEWRVVRDVLKSRRDSEIMPFKFADVFIEGLLSIDGYIDIDNRTPKEVAYLILQRIHGKDTLPLHSSKSTLSAPAARPTVAETVIKARIFLCHASEDKPQVEKIYGRLRELGFRPWMDKMDLLPGQRWQQEIPRTLRAADFILIFFSRSSVMKRGYVQREFKLAMDLLQEMPEHLIHIIPVRLDDCTIPEQFGFLHWCNLFEDDGFERLVHAIHLGLSHRQQPASGVPTQEWVVTASPRVPAQQGDPISPVREAPQCENRATYHEEDSSAAQFPQGVISQPPHTPQMPAYYKIRHMYEALEGKLPHIKQHVFFWVFTGLLLIFTGLLLILRFEPGSRSISPQIGAKALAPWEEYGCLYPGTVLRAEQYKTLVRFDFGKEAWVTTDNMYLLPTPSLSELKLNADVYVRFESEGVWILGQIKEEQAGKKLVWLDSNITCRGNKTHKWATAEDILLRK